jgi:hypothetical protein
MSKSALDRMTWFILGLGVAASLGALALSGSTTALSVAVGVSVAIANWYLLRFIVARVVSGNVRRQGAFSFVLFLKMGGLMALVFLLLRSGLFSPIAFTVGMSCLVVGALLGAFVHVLTAAPEAESKH